MVQLAIHDVKSIRFERVLLEDCIDTVFVARVNIKNERGETVRLTLFSDKKQKLRFTEVTHLK